MRKGMVLAGALAAATVPQIANAALVVTDVRADPSGKTTDLKYTPAALKLGGVYASRLLVTGTDDGTAFSLYAYCLDIFQPLNEGSFVQSPLSLLVPSATRQAQLLALFANATQALNGESNSGKRSTISAATQMALWEIAYEGGSGYNVKNGQFDLSGGNGAAARTLANDYLQKVLSGSWVAPSNLSVGVLHSDRWQDLIYLKSVTPPPAVPEPGTWGMMILGMGAVGYSMRRRRKVNVAFA